LALNAAWSSKTVLVKAVPFESELKAKLLAMLGPHRQDSCDW